jgi:DNA polymerase-3 subunit gamma/tau
MSQVLYRKYRSQDFDHLVGQEHITKILKNAVKSKNLSHAYLFVGSRGTGKTSAARILAKAVNCLDIKKDGNPCTKCEICKAIEGGHFLDLIEIDAASNRGIDQIRELKEKIEFSPSEGKYKVYIIDEVHMLTREAFNALLKTLEEPPEHVIFILATTEPHKLPSTILSRCQRYDFRLGTEEEIRSVVKGVSKKEKIKLEKEALELIVQNAKGSYRDSLSLLDVILSGQTEDPSEVTAVEVRKILGIPDSTMVYYLLENLVKGDAVKSLDLISELDSKGINLQQFTASVLEMLRDILVKKLRGTLQEEEYSFAYDLSNKEVLHLINLFVQAERNMKMASNQSLVLEMIIPSVNINSEVEEKPKKDPPKEKPVKSTAPKPEKEKESKKVGKEEKKVVKKKISSKLSFKVLEKSWKKIVEAIKPANGHLFAFLDSANLVELKEDRLILDVPFQFHKERIESHKSQEAIRNIMEEFFGESCRVVCNVNENVKKKRRKVSPDVVLKNLPITPKKKKIEKKEEKGGINIEAIFEGV